jgi:hypothetical protein
MIIFISCDSLFKLEISGFLCRIRFECIRYDLMGGYTEIIKFDMSQNHATFIESHILRRFNILKKVGSGAYGHVWKV